MCSDLKLKEEGQPVDYDLYSKFSPVPMEIVDGNIFLPIQSEKAF